MVPGTMILILGFFCILYSWMNAFAEMMRFADREFYQDWWNSRQFARFYRTWNVIVHEWLYYYVFRDTMRLCQNSHRKKAAARVTCIGSHQREKRQLYGTSPPLIFDPSAENIPPLACIVAWCQEQPSKYLTRARPRSSDTIIFRTRVLSYSFLNAVPTTS